MMSTSMFTFSQSGAQRKIPGYHTRVSFLKKILSACVCKQVKQEKQVFGSEVSKPGWTVW